MVLALGISQADFSRLIGVTPRAVTLWVTDERAVPGPVIAYVRLLHSLPANLRQAELARLKTRKDQMKDGMYGISFQYRGDTGLGALVFDGGRVYGADVGAVKYDGIYTHNEATGLMDVHLKITFPPNVQSVFGVTNPFEWAIDVKTSLDPRQDHGRMDVVTSLGQVITGEYHYLRALPEAA